MGLNTWEPRFPAMRDEVQYAVAALADEGYQRVVWQEGLSPRQPYAYDFDMACHALLDDIDVFGDPAKLIGSVLRDERELGALKHLGESLVSLIEDIGVTGTFERAVASAKWPPVLAAARKALAVIGRPTTFP